MDVSPIKWRMRRWTQQTLLDWRARARAAVLQSDEELRKRSLALKYRAKSREPLAKLLPEAYALVREAGRRTLNMRHFDITQLLRRHRRKTGPLPKCKPAKVKPSPAAAAVVSVGTSFAAKASHLATVNDYLGQRRDAEWMKLIAKVLGMSVGIIQSAAAARRSGASLLCDAFHYGTAIQALEHDTIAKGHP